MRSASLVRAVTAGIAMSLAAGCSSLRPYAEARVAPAAADSVWSNSSAATSVSHDASASTSSGKLLRTVLVVVALAAVVLAVAVVLTLEDSYGGYQAATP